MLKLRNEKKQKLLALKKNINSELTKTKKKIVTQIDDL